MIWPTVITLVGTLSAVALTLWSGRQTEQRRLQGESAEQIASREHELALRDVEHLELHRARLLAERLPAYRAFTEAFLRMEALDEDAAILWSQRQFHASRIGQPGGLTAAQLDAINESWKMASAEAFRAVVEVQRTAALLELVASEPVSALARHLVDAAGKARIARLTWNSEQSVESKRMSLLEDWQAAQRALQARRAELADGIRTELSLDR